MRGGHPIGERTRGAAVPFRGGTRNFCSIWRLHFRAAGLLKLEGDLGVFVFLVEGLGRAMKIQV